MESTKENKLVMMPSRSRLSEVLQHSDSPVDVFGVDESGRPAGARVQQLLLSQIALSSYQVRSTSNEVGLEPLADSITAKGVLQPLLVRPIAADDDREESFELIAGERRLRAARLAGLDQVPALIVPLDDRETLEAAIVENAQREDLNALEEARAYQRLAVEFSLTQREIAEAVGKNRSTVSNSLRLLQLDERVLEYIAQGSLTAGHGRALLMLDDADLQFRFARRSVEQQLSVHALERKIARHLENSGEAVLDEDDEREQARIARQRERVAGYLGLEQVGLAFDTQGRRRLSLTFDTEASWKRFIAKIRD